MCILMHKVASIPITVLFCIIICLCQIPPGVRGTGGTMGTVVSLIDLTYGTLTAVCALKARTFLPVCWGALPVGTPIPSTQPMWAITAGVDFVCGLRYDAHTPICWGGNADVTSIPAGYAVTSYSTINAGDGHVCAIRDNNSANPGTVDCWGDNTFDQLLPPPNVPMLSVTSGSYYSCGISLVTKKVLCWGKLLPASYPSPPSNGQFKAIFSSPFDMCGIHLNGYTECWMDGSSYNMPYPNQLFSSIAGTYDDTCAIQKLTHEVLCWSRSDIAPTPMTYALASLSASVTYKKNSQGTYDNYGYYCGVREDIEVGNLYCWGTSQNPFATILSSFSASKGICRDQCPEGQYPVLANGLCPNPKHKLCLDCAGECPLSPPPTPSPSINNNPNSSSPSTAPPPAPNFYTPTGNIHPSASIPSSPSSVSKMVLPISIAAGSFILISILATLLIVHYRNRPCISRVPPPEPSNALSDDTNSRNGSALLVFSRRQIQAATNNYQTVIGKGGFGNVYKGILGNKQTVAIKKPHKLTGGEEYELEFDMLSKLNHPSLVNLLGYCKKDNTLVFPYMANGSLRDRMRDPAAREILSDTKLRLGIAVQVVKGLEYMHESNVIHRDVKTANILLDDAWNAYIADFGISRNSPIGDETHCITRIVGTPAYLDPDYHKSGELTTKSDVFSFGVVLLELASGLDPEGLAHNARSFHAEGRLSELVDQNLQNIYRDCHLSLLKLAILCIEKSRAKRPTMAKVAQHLQRLFSQINL